MASSEGIVREALELLAGGDAQRLSELVHPDYRDHAWHGPERGPASMLAWRDRLRDAFADVQLEPRALVAGNDGHVAARLRFRGLHVAPYAAIEPSGRTVEVDEFHIWRLVDGRLAEHWGLRDELAVLRQMGVEPLGVSG
jgi:predicted ester cyclase